MMHQQWGLFIGHSRRVDVVVFSFIVLVLFVVMPAAILFSLILKNKIIILFHSFLAAIEAQECQIVCIRGVLFLTLNNFNLFCV